MGQAPVKTAAFRARLIQMEVRPGCPDANAVRMRRHLDAARRDGIALAVFPELAIPGYLLGDEWERPAFLRECERCTEEVVAASAGLTVVFGNVAVDRTRRNEDGRVRKYNAAFVAEDGRLRAPEGDAPYPFVIKALLPNYREFDDSRHFYDLRKLALERRLDPAALLRPVPTRVGRLGCALCEDAWDQDYALSPLACLAAAGADWLVDISASPFTRDKNHKRHRVFAAQAARLGRPLLYVNQVGLQDNGKTVYTFDGSSSVYDAAGRLAAQAPAFSDTVLDVPLPPPDVAVPAPAPDDAATLTDALLYGTRAFTRRCGVERVVIGVSGGIDSAVAAALYAQVLPPEKLVLVNMPTRHNSARTRGLAADLAARLGGLFAEVPIEDSVALTVRQLDGLPLRGPDGACAEVLRLRGVTLENVQARDRSARVLAAVAAAVGGVFTCNANKAEATVGYTTLYGDLGGFFANLADLWKHDVYAVGRCLNGRGPGRAVVPDGCFTVTPSAELSPDQDVEQNKGDPLNYPYHDRLFASWVERWDRATPEDNLEWYLAGDLAARIGYAGRIDELFPDAAAFVADLERWWRQYQGIGIAKRIQAPPLLAVTRRAFGFDHREAQLGPRFTRRYAELKADLLARAQS